MSNQISLWSDTTKQDMIEKIPEAELSAYKKIYHATFKVFQENYADASVLQPRLTIQHTTIFFFTDTFCRLSLRGKRSEVSILSKYVSLIPEDIEVIENRTKDNFCRISVQNIEDLDRLIPMFSLLVQAYIDQLKKEFDCCSRYLECSKEKACIHPDMRRSMLCGYKRVMKSGHIFFGENRNI